MSAKIKVDLSFKNKPNYPHDRSDDDTILLSLNLRNIKEGRYCEGHSRTNDMIAGVGRW